MKTRTLLIALISALVPLLSWGFEEYECDEKLRLTKDGLVLAAVNGDAGAIACIIDSETPGVEVDSEDQVGRTPLFWAAFNGHEDAVRMLILRYVERLNPILFVAIIITNFNCKTFLLIAILFYRGANVNKLSHNDNTPLIKAASVGALGTVKVLLDEGADINHQGTWNSTFCV